MDAEAAATGELDQRGRFVRRLDREPEGSDPVGGRPDGSGQVGVGLADALDADPVVPEPRLPRDRPFAAGDDVRAEARSREQPDDAGDVVRLDRVLADPRVGKGGGELARRRFDGRLVDDLDRRAEPSRRGPQRVGDRRQAVGRVSRG
jgi:hypothetical protein